MVALPEEDPAKDRIPPAVPDNPTVKVEPVNVKFALVLGAAPAPPPKTTEVDARSAEDAHVDALEKYGIPPEVPATVSAGVVVGVATEIKPPVNDTEVTVPDVGVAQCAAVALVVVNT